MAKDTWLKLHTSLLTSSKFVNLPTNDHRWAFICLLLLTKKGLESSPENFLLAHLSLGKKRWKTVKKELIESGLLDSEGSVNGFEDSQLTPDAIRMRAKRSPNKARTNPEQVRTDSRKQIADSRKQNKKEEKNAPPEMMEVTTDDGKRIQGLTRRFVQLRLENDPGAKIPGILMAWDAEMARIHIADKRPYDQIQEVIDHSMADEFWRVNILTPHDLRQKFPKLVLNLKRGTGKKSGFAGPDNRAERNREVMENTIKRFEDADDNQSIDGGGSDLQRSLESGPAGRLPGGAE